MKDKVTIVWKFVLTIIRNKYLITLLAFFIWVTFLDSYSLVDRYSNLKKLNELKKEADFFRNELKLYKTQYKELFSDKNDLEKFAREQFLMKEENEDIFIIISD